MDLGMCLPLVITLIIAFPLDQVFQVVVTHSAIQYHLDLILLLAIDESWVAWAVDNLNTTQTPECTKEKYNVKIKVKGSLLRSHQQPM
jgi:hypothetical protein